MVAPCIEPFRHANYRFTMRWLRKQVLRVTNPRLTNALRQGTMPARFTPFARSMLTLVGAIGQLETEGSFRDEVGRWHPALHELVTRPEEGAVPVDLAAARRKRADGDVQRASVG